MILNYFGSKARIIEQMDRVIKPLINKNTVMGDLFAGTGVVGNHFKNRVKQVVANDQELYSYVVNKALLTTVYTNRIQCLVKEMNELPGIKGLVFKYFSPHGGKMFFTIENAMKIDAMRTALSSWHAVGKINYKEFIFLLGSLLYSVTRYANTAGTFRAFLKTFAGRALKPIVMLPIHKNAALFHEHRVTKLNISNVKGKFDLVYLDPPYNSHHYGAYYSFFNYLCAYDESIEINPATGVMKQYNKSQFGFKATAFDAFNRLIGSIDSRYIVMSYNSAAIMGKAELASIMSKRGAVTLYKFLNRNYKPNYTIKNNQVVEYIFVIDTTLPSSFTQTWLS